MPHSTMTDPRSSHFSVASLYDNEEYSDMILIDADGRSYPLHRLVVCRQSDHLKTTMRPGFREGDTGVVRLDDANVDFPPDVERMIKYFYFGDYQQNSSRRHRSSISSQHHRHSPSTRPRRIVVADPLVDVVDQLDDHYSEQRLQTPHSKLPPTRNSDTSMSIADEEDSDQSSVQDEPETIDESELLTHVHMYAMADKFLIPGLKELARQKFKDHLKHHIDDPALPEAFVCAYHYTTTPESDRGLRNIVLSTFRSNSALRRRPDIRQVISSSDENTAQLRRELENMRLGFPTH